MSDILIVRKEEHHLWRTCPCDLCAAERDRTTYSKPTLPSTRKIPVDAAYLFGLIPSRNPHGSVARELMKKTV
ncbi:hypothetical protein LCGC14_0249400 [marine sediment metagenome]|uniref:Uncharacterized protein n=1 Tax=marine sediment metagenome TaxID=412755 RepID=A0A0F9ULQ2_9ZZZZ